MKRTIIFGCLLVSTVLLTGGCEHKQNHTQGAAAAPLLQEAALVKEEPAPPPVVTIYETVPMPGQLKPLPVEEEAVGKKRGKNADAVIIETANAASRLSPDTQDFYNAMVEYPFDKGTLYQIYTAPLRMTDVQLQPGEKIMGRIVIGDSERWILARGVSMHDGKEQEHIYIKPKRHGLATTMAINTDKRSYTIELHSFKKTYMAAVQWMYPHDEVQHYMSVAQIKRQQKEQITDTKISIDELNFAYDVNVENGKKPVWFPKRIFDDGKKTFIEFPEKMLSYEAPVLFVESEDGNQLVNYRQRNNYFIVDRLFPTAQLISGTDKQTIVRIVKEAGKRGRDHSWFECDSPNVRRQRLCERGRI